eukprot:6196654-Pleurochrysis_carterae.AAC.4
MHAVRGRAQGLGIARTKLVQCRQPLHCCAALRCAARGGVVFAGSELARTRRTPEGRFSRRTPDHGATSALARTIMGIGREP